MNRLTASTSLLDASAAGAAWYHLVDTQFSTVAMIDSVGSLVERVDYSACHCWAGDLTGAVPGRAKMVPSESTFAKLIKPVRLSRTNGVNHCCDG